MATIKGIKAGTTTITASYGGKTVSQSFTVNKITPSLTFTANGTDLYYTGSAQTIGTVSYGGDGVVYYSYDNNSWTQLTLTNRSGKLTRTDNGTYNVYLKSDAGTNYLAVSSFKADSKIINKGTGSLSLSASSGTITYSATTTEFTVTRAGDGTISVSTSNSSVATASVSGTKVTVTRTGYGSATITVSVAEGTHYTTPSNKTYAITCVKAARSGAVSCSDVTYGSNVTASVSGNSETGTITWGVTNGTGKATISSSGVVTPTQAGTVTITASVAETSNYKSYTATSKSITISKADITPTVSMSGYTYGGTKSTPTVSGNSGSGTVTYYYNTSNSNSGGTAWSNVTSSTSLNAGTYYMYAVVDATTNYNGATSAVKSFTISKATPSLSITLATGLTYSGSNQALVTAASVTGGGAIYTGVGSSTSSAPSSWTTWSTSCTGKDSGTYYVWAKADASTNYNAVSQVCKGSVTIATLTATVASYPSAKTTTWTGSSITLINGGSATGATFTYSTSESGTYSTTIPSGTAVADSKTIYWKLTANTNYNTTGLTTSGSCDGTISAKSISIPAPTGTTGTYTGSAYKATFASCTGATITKYRYSTNGTSWTESTSNQGQTNAGTLYTQAYYTASTNYTGSGWSSSATITVNKATASLPTTISGASAAYHNTAELSYSSDYTSGCTLKFRYDTENGENWTETTTKSEFNRTSIGDTAVQMKVIGNNNYNDSAWSSTVTLTVYQATDAKMTVNLGTDLVYDGSTKILATGTTTGGDNHGVLNYYLGYSSSDSATDSTVTWGSVNSSISATNAGTYYIYYKFTCDSDHSNAKGCTKVGGVVISKASGTITYSASSPSDTIYCTTEATAASSMVTSKTITISTGATGATGTISYSVDLSGWSTTGTELTIPAGTSAGEYTPTVTAKSAATSNYNEKTSSQKLTVTITAQALDHIVMTLASSVNYLSSVTPTTVAYYTSGASTTVSATYTEDSTVSGYPYVEIS